MDKNIKNTNSKFQNPKQIPKLKTQNLKLISKFAA
jgi:hypothetical protein